MFVFQITGHEQSRYQLKNLRRLSAARRLVQCHHRRLIFCRLTPTFHDRCSPWQPALSLLAAENPAAFSQQSEGAIRGLRKLSCGMLDAINVQPLTRMNASVCWLNCKPHDIVSNTCRIRLAPYKNILAGLVVDQGGIENVTEARLQLCRRFAALAVQAEAMEARLAAGAEMDLQQHALLSSTLVRIGQRIGLDRVPRDISVPTVEDYLAHRTREHASRAGDHPSDEED